MNCFSTDAHNFRQQRRTCLASVCLSFILLVSFVSGRPSDADLVYGDVDDSSTSDELWQNAKEIPTDSESHPVVYYKEDYVSEDYDPSKDNTSTTVRPIYRPIKPEKVYFDYYPSDDVATNSDVPNVFDNVKIEVISLNEDENKHLRRREEHWKNVYGDQKRRHKRDVTDTTGGVAKRELDLMDIFTKYPKTAVSSPLRAEGRSHSIARRQYRGNNFQNQRSSYVVRPSWYHQYQTENSDQVLPNQAIYQKHPIRGIYYNPISVPGNSGFNRNSGFIANRIGGAEDDRVIWDAVPYESQPPRAIWPTVQESQTRRPPPPLIHAPDRPTQRPTTTRRPSPPLIHAPERPTTPRPTLVEHSLDSDNSNSISGNGDSRDTFRPQTEGPRRPGRPTPAPQQPLSKCVWAIVSCCSRNNRNIRYRCFEQMGCQGAFWDLNPCADDIQDEALDAADKYFD